MSGSPTMIIGTSKVMHPRSADDQREVRRRGRGTVTGLVAVHVVAATLAVAALSSVPAAGAAVGGGIALAYVWGLQHGFAADHIAAIDDSTRLLVAHDRRAAGSAGLAFATGHGITITAATIALVSLTHDGIPAWLETGALSLAVAFLALVGVANARLLGRLATSSPADGWPADGARSLLARLGGERLRAGVSRPVHLIVVGSVFGVASIAEVFAIVVVGQRGLASEAVVPLALVVTFSAGLALVDTADSVLMARTYRWAQADLTRRRHANLAATSLTVVVCVGVVLILASSLVVERLGLSLPVLRPLAGLAHRFELVGAGAVGLFATWWVTAWLVWRRRHDRPVEPPACRQRH